MKMHPAPALEFPGISFLLTAAWIALASPILLAQSNSVPGAASSPTPTTNATSAPSFDVATIKPNSSSEPVSWMGIRNTPDGIEAAFVTLPMLVQRAYGLRTSDQVSGAPKWATSDRFDVEAKMSEADVAVMAKLSQNEKSARRELMMQSLLAERFKLKVHPETKQVPVYELVVAKGGPKLKDAATDSSGHLEKGEDGKPLAGFIQPLEDKTIAQGYSMKALADFLSQPSWSGLGRPVLDKTGLTGTYDFTFDWSPQLMRSLPGEKSIPALAEEAGPIFTALKEVGLKLQPATGPIDIVVIDHVEHPTAN